jgi:hypothetical protein
MGTFDADANGEGTSGLNPRGREYENGIKGRNTPVVVMKSVKVDGAKGVCVVKLRPATEESEGRSSHTHYHHAVFTIGAVRVETLPYGSGEGPWGTIPRGHKAGC